MTVTTTTTRRPSPLAATATRWFVVPAMGAGLNELIIGIVGLVGDGVANSWGPIVAAGGMLITFGAVGD